MPVKLGNNNLTFSGISEIYVGSNKVYSATPPGPPIIDNPVNEYFCVYSAKNFTIRFEKVQTASGASGNLNYNNLKLKYSTNKTTWTEVSAAQGFNFNGGTLYYIYTSSADVGTTSSSTDLGLQSASWGQVCSAPAYGYYSYTSTRMNFSGTSTIYLMGNIRTIAQGKQATPYNSYVGSKTKIDYVGRTVYSSDYYIYYSRACGLGGSTYQNYSSQYNLIARGIFNLRGTSNSRIDISNLYIGDHEASSYPTFTYSTGTPYTPPSEDYFYVENLTNSANALNIKKTTSSAPTLTVYYSTDKTNWSSISTSTTDTSINIPAGSKVYLKCSDNAWSSRFNYNRITCSSNFSVGGNIMSLLFGDNFIGQTIIPTGTSYVFGTLFYRAPLINIDNLVLPATTLASGCYSEMFSGCTGLTTIPSNLLPATSLAGSCYWSMFYGCTGLTTLPSNLLPATTLKTYCYYCMFSGCTGLTTIPSNLLPATSILKNCYTEMFRNCTGLTTIPSNLLPATSLGESCYSSMFSGCTGLTKAPILPATTLPKSGYSYMFNGCSSLNEIRCYANNISATNCTNNWVNGVAASGTFYKLGSASWTTGTSGIPSGWTVKTS